MNLVQLWDTVLMLIIIEAYQTFMCCDSVQDSYEEQEFWLTRLYWVGIRLNPFEMFEESFKLSIKMKTMWFQVWNSVVWKPLINSEKSKSLELTI